MPFIRYTAKKILMITALSNTLAPMVKTYIRAGVIIESVIDCVRWASLACPGAFYIYENFLKKFQFFCNGFCFSFVLYVKDARK